MKLGKLYESFTTPETDFLRLYQTEDLSGCKTLNETKDTIKNIFSEADNYANNNKLEYKYFQLAKKPLWEELEINQQHFILKGFDAYINIDLTESLNNITPFVVVQNGNVKDLENGQRIEINESFIRSLIPLQKEIFLEALTLIEDETMSKLKKVWKIEQQRIDKWVKTCKINLKGN
jgi:hypothetical protein